MKKYSFGIDLGTSNSTISYVVDGKPVAIADPIEKTPVIPSVVGIDRKGEFLVGHQAEQRAQADKKIREAKRHMGTDEMFVLGGRALRAEDVGALVLKKMKQVAEASLGTEVDSAVISVPAYFDDLPRRATEWAGRLAGVTPLRLISEPVAAALAFGINRLDDEGLLLVFDFGGGTLDVSIIDMIAGVLEVKATDGDKQLGGKDLDEALIAFALKKSGIGEVGRGTDAWEAVRREAEKCKKSLSEQSVAEFYVPEAGGSGSNIDVSITRDEFEAVIKPFLDRAIACVNGALSKAGIEKTAVDKLLLVGGSCYIPAVRAAVEGLLGVKAESGVDPDLAVSLGASISAGLKTGEIDSKTSIVVQDAATYRMGTSSLSQVGNQMMLLFTELMPANAAIPWFKSERFHLLTRDQDEVKINVLQDPSGKAVLAVDAIHTGAIGVITDIPPSTTDEPRAIDIELRFDENQIIRVNGKIVGLDREVTVQLNSESARPDALEALGKTTTVDEIWESSPLATRNSPLIKRAEKVLEERPDNLEVIEAALHDLKRAISQNDSDAVQEARDKLTEILADMI